MKPTITTPPRPPRADAVRNRAAVIQGARKVMAKKGLDAGIDEIARVAKVGVGTVYRHFPTKDDLVAALADYRFERLAEFAHEALAEDDPAAAFERFLFRAGELQAADLALSEVMRGHENVMPEAAERVGLLELTREVLTRAQNAGAIRPDVEAEDIPMIMCGIGTTTNHPAPFIGKDSWRRFLALVLDGMRTEGATKLPPRN
jgi:AcrR family transcriptional regulator